MAEADSTGKGILEVSTNTDTYPYLVSAYMNGRIGWDFVTIKQDSATSISINPEFMSNEDEVIAFTQGPPMKSTAKPKGAR
jgi:hypothetical protein